MALSSRGQQLADALVHPLHHADVVGPRAEFRAVGLDRPLVVRLARRLEGPVRRVVSHLQEERPAGIFLDERQRMLGDQVGQVALLLDEFGVGVQAGVAERIGVGVVVEVGAGEPEEILEAMSVGPELGLITQVPLAVEGRGVPLFLEQGRQARARDRQATILVVVADDPVEAVAAVGIGR